MVLTNATIHKVNLNAWVNVVRDLGSDHFRSLVSLIETITDLDAKAREFYEIFITQSAKDEIPVTFPVRVQKGASVEFAIVPEAGYVARPSSPLPAGSVTFQTTNSLFRKLLLSIFNLLNKPDWGLVGPNQPKNDNAKLRDILLHPISTYCREIGHIYPNEGQMGFSFDYQTTTIMQNIENIAQDFASRLGSLVVLAANPKEKKKFMSEEDYNSFRSYLEQLNTWVMDDYCSTSPQFDLDELNRLATMTPPEYPSTTQQ